MRTFILGLFLLAWLAVVLWAAGSPLISPSASASASFVAPAMARTFVQAPCLMPRKPGLPALSPARQAMLERARRRGVNQPPPPQAPLTGTMKGILLLIDFSDNVGTTSPDHFEDLIFSKGTYSTGSLRDYYLEASYGQFDVQGDVLKKWLRAPQSYSYYTNKGAGLGNYPQNAQKMVEDAVQLADPDVDFSQYDNDGDGTVEYLLVVHAGPGAETRLFDPGDHIWSHYHVLNQPLTVDNVKVYPYVIMPEDGNIGVFCHESGHAFGLPDLYDTDNSSQGIGFWGLMSAGAWGNNGVTPVHPCAWSKVQWGWVSPTAPSQNLNDETIPPVETNKAIYRLWTDGNTSNKQYFLVENRQATKFDQYIPGSGLLIYHIDDEVTGGNRDNSREWYPGHTDSGHYRVAIEQADGRWDLEKNKNYGDDSDPWPGSGNKTEFNASSTPNSRDYAGNDTKVAVEDIRTSGSDVIADLKVTTGGAGTTYKISGKVTTSSGAGISGVTVKAEKDGSVKGQATTASNGGYQITDLAAGTYTVTPSKQNYTFNPSSRQVTVGPDQTAVNFVGSTEQRNNPPTLKNGSVSPSTGNVSTTFTYKVTYTDADNDAPSYVRVYIDGQAYDMNKDPKDNTYTDGVVYTYDKTNLAKGSHKYHFEASDGKDTARLPSSGDTDGPTVQNRPPSASNVKITPTSPKAGQALTANYTFDDPDGDAESGTQIRWYRNGVVQSSLNDKQVVPTGTTKAGEQWRFTVKPSDGTDFGTEQKSNTVVIGEGDGEDLNNPPTVSNVKITPASPVEGDALTANYTYSDPDGDAESGTQIRWYRNGVLRAAYNDQTTLPANTTRAGERWYFTVRPKDGKDFGPQKKSGTVIVKVKQVPNDPPRASDLSITPSQPKAGDALTGSYTYSDPNGDAESGTQIRWYRNGAVVSAYNDRTTVPSGVTKEGEEWYFTVRPKDGRDFGQVQQSPKVTVAAAGGVTNDPPTATNLRIVPAKPKAGWKLTVQYKYSDPNNDPEGNTQIRWFKDGVLQGDYNNKQVLPAGVTQAGEQWHCTVKPHDGKDFGTVRASGAVTIQATGGAGDFSGDGRVDLTDLEQFRAHWGRKQGDADFEARFDLTGDGIVNLDDFWAFWANNDLDPTDRNNVLHTTWTHGDVTGPGPTDESGLGAPDDAVDFHDLLVFAQAWQSAAGEANWHTHT
ncbi:MAG TPA: M6 family metalloprotease domain-containing protein [Armatimonadetes bacterium]|nr:M6 family metalloprotease domain-containing protein [Armatimonadota bacterium]